MTQIGWPSAVTLSSLLGGASLLLASPVAAETALAQTVPSLFVHGASINGSSVDTSDTSPVSSLLANAPVANTQSAQIVSTSLQFSPPPLPDRGRPRGRSSGGASRGSCDIAGQLPLTALVPVTSTVDASLASDAVTNVPVQESVYSVTSQAHPTFWFYVPYALGETPVEFVLQDEQNNTIYQRRFTEEADEFGVMSVALPETAPAMEAGTLYHWYFMAYCDEDNPTFVEGWTERVALDADLTVALANTTAREQVALYAQNGIWQEAITLLGEQYRREEDNLNLTEDWTSLLTSVDLGEIALQPMVDCCRE
ncbi:MAG: DUF928 domain-containing protein [Cyanobacteria bacterium J06621_11]